MYAELALAESEKRFRALVSASSDVVYRMSADFTELRQLEGHLFVAASPGPNRNWLEEYIHPEDRDLARTAIRDAIDRKRILELECRVFLADGSVGWTHTRAVPMLDMAGEITEWIGMVTNVTANKNAEHALAYQRRMYEAILTNTPDLAYVWNLEHRFIYANEGLLRMWGRTWEEAIGRNCLELGYEPWHAALHDREIEQVVATKQPVRGEVPFNGAFGRRYYDYLLVPVIGASGEVEAVAGTTRDVTERKQLEGSLIDADRRKDEFLATLAHELRNPLAPIRNSVSLLRLSGAAGPAGQMWEMMDRQVSHMVRLVDDLMEVSRITRGKIELRKSVVDLAEVIAAAVETSRPLIESARHELIVEIPPQPLLVEADAMRLAQVFSNLLNNAVRYTDPGGRIGVVAGREDGRAMVTVADTGIGIAPEALPRVFDMFVQINARDSRGQTGLGIGLTLVRSLIEMHGGSVAARSAGAGRGSEFVVRLPLAREGASLAKAGLNAARKIRGVPRVMVVDDNRDAADSLAAVLKILGAEVCVTHDGQSALDQLGAFHPAAVFLDLGMPGMDGYETARHMRARDDARGTMIIALTGWGQESDRHQTQAAGFNQHLVKPADITALRAVLASLAD
jgi:PAS domain S-box-containing protein